LLAFANHPCFEFVCGDLRCSEDVERAVQGIDSIVHLAAIVGDVPCQAQPRVAVETNVEGTRLLAQKAHAQGVRRLVFASTCSTYGISDTEVAADETRELNPISLYAKTKVECEHLLLDHCVPGCFEIVVLRFATAYGISVRTRFDLMIHSLVFEAMQRGEIVVYAEETWRPYVHVYDMAAVLQVTLAAPATQVCGEIFNAGSDEQNYTKAEIIRLILEEIPGTSVVSGVGKLDPRTYRVNFGKLRHRLGFTPQRTVRHGIREIISALEHGLLAEQDYKANGLSQYTEKMAI
jgi:nucleoside-diphosphate-sugar epimerase